MLISIPYGSGTLEAQVSKERIIFRGEMNYLPPLKDFRAELYHRLDNPTGCRPLREMVSPSDKIVILVEDNTRHTPVKQILPVLMNYLETAGIAMEQIEILTAPGTHRVMSEDELLEKVGEEAYYKLKITQHDFQDQEAIIDLGEVEVADMKIPIHVNKKAVEADFIIGLGNIVPHCDAGFSGGAKIVQPGICGFATTAATHIAAALLEDIPLGNVDSPCRMGMEEVARKIGLSFIINVVKNNLNEVVEIAAGDFVQAHRQGVEVSRKVYGVEVPELADIVIVSSSPCDIDYWQAEKGVIAAYFAVKEGGCIIFAAPCPEGMEHNHPRLRDWLKLSYTEAACRARKVTPDNQEEDLISADLAMCNSRLREKAEVFLVSQGLTVEDSAILGYRKIETLQEALDIALAARPEAAIGILPKGGVCLPIVGQAR